mgnify:CR=1 FL=1
MKKLLILLLGLVILLTGCGPKEDELTKDVNKAIDAFITNYAQDYIKVGEETVLNENVILAIKALQDNGYDVNLNDYASSEEVKAYFDGVEITSMNAAYKAVLISRAFGITSDKATTYLKGLTEDDVDVWSYTYGVIALNITKVNKELKDAIVAKLNVIRDEDFRDADYAGYALIAASGMTLDRNPIYKLINDNLTENGVQSWGNANASVTASVILGLIADGKSPITEEYTTNDVNLVEALLKYENEGAFVNVLAEDVDLMFATPQAFSALVSYKLLAQGKPANIFA